MNGYMRNLLRTVRIEEQNTARQSLVVLYVYISGFTLVILVEPGEKIVCIILYFIRPRKSKRHDFFLAALPYFRMGIPAGHSTFLPFFLRA